MTDNDRDGFKEGRVGIVAAHLYFALMHRQVRPSGFFTRSPASSVLRPAFEQDGRRQFMSKTQTDFKFSERGRLRIQVDQPQSACDQARFNEIR